MHRRGLLCLWKKAGELDSPGMRDRAHGLPVFHLECLMAVAIGIVLMALPIVFKDYA